MLLNKIVCIFTACLSAMHWGFFTRHSFNKLLKTLRATVAFGQCITDNTQK